MSRYWWLLAIPLLGGLGYWLLTARTHLRVGDPAPEFSLTGSDGQTHTLSEMRGSVVVLAWYPRAFTSVCTTECAAFAAADNPLQKLGVAYFAASTDSLDKNRAFAQALRATYPILSDPTGKTARAYGVRTPLGIASRVTFLIDPQGIIRHIESNVDSGNHAEQLADKIRELGLSAS